MTDDVHAHEMSLAHDLPPINFRHSSPSFVSLEDFASDLIVVRYCMFAVFGISDTDTSRIFRPWETQNTGLSLLVITIMISIDEDVNSRETKFSQGDRIGVWKDRCGIRPFMYKSLWGLLSVGVCMAL